MSVKYFGHDIEWTPALYVMNMAARLADFTSSDFGMKVNPTLDAFLLGRAKQEWDAATGAVQAAAAVRKMQRIVNRYDLRLEIKEDTSILKRGTIFEVVGVSQSRHTNMSFEIYPIADPDAKPTQEPLVMIDWQDIHEALMIKFQLTKITKPMQEWLEKEYGLYQLASDLKEGMSWQLPISQLAADTFDNDGQLFPEFAAAFELEYEGTDDDDDDDDDDFDVDAFVERGILNP